MTANKIVPCIWYTTEGGKLASVIAYYSMIFDKNFQAGNIAPLGQTPSGNAEMCNVTIFGQNFSLMSTEIEHHSLNDSISLMISCKDQNEIDLLWDYFSQTGEESQCGWCIDKYGLRWQIIPANMEELMSKPNAFEVMMKQKKIIIDEYLK